MGVVWRALSLLTLTTSQEEEAVRIELAGELDLSSALTFDEQLRRIEDEADERAVLLDLEGLKFMDSTGLRLIVNAHQRALKAGRRLAIVHASKTVRRIFRLTGMLDRLDIVEDKATPV
jgi:anti-sigma B factor antagonist